MCIHREEIRNKYTGQKLVVDCGHCPSCKQKKANARSRRIVNESVDRLDEIDRIFVTLTYQNKYIPYIKENELIDFQTCKRNVLSVYRDKDVHAYFNVKKGQICTREVPGCTVASFWRNDFGTEYYSSIPSFCEDSLVSYNYLRATGDRFNSVLYGRIGIAYYKDLQKFLKRFRQYLKRRGIYEGKFSFFGCSEYGSTTCRPHFHLLLHFPRGYYQVVKSAIASCWLYDSYDRSLRNVELAIKPAAYLASYCNSDKTVQGILNSKPFCQKHSYSQHFGFGKDSYSFDNVKQAFYNGSLRTLEEIRRDGTVTKRLVPLPKYVVNRYFPKFKGFHLLTPDEKFDIARKPQRIFGYRKNLELSLEECRSIRTMLENRRKLFVKTLEDESDYPFIYSRIWELRSANLLVDFHNNMLDELESYDNIEEFYSGTLESDLVRLDCRKWYEVDFNKFAQIVDESAYYERKYFEKDKKKKIKNLGYSLISNM